MKQMEVTRKKIGGNTFFIKPFPAFTAANISGELSAVVGPIVGGLAPLIEGKGSDEIMNMDIAKAIPSLVDALSQVDGDKVQHLMERLLVTYGNVSVTTKEDPGSVDVLDMDMANEIFCGEIENMVLLCVEVVKVNFGGFFKRIAGQSGSLQEAEAKKTTMSLSMASST